MFRRLQASSVQGIPSSQLVFPSSQQSGVGERLQEPFTHRFCSQRLPVGGQSSLSLQQPSAPGGTSFAHRLVSRSQLALVQGSPSPQSLFFEQQFGLGLVWTHCWSLHWALRQGSSVSQSATLSQHWGRDVQVLSVSHTFRVHGSPSSQIRGSPGTRQQLSFSSELHCWFWQVSSVQSSPSSQPALVRQQSAVSL